MKTKFPTLAGVAAASLLALTIPNTSAVLLSYDIGPNSSVSAHSNPSTGLAISTQLDTNLPNVSFSLGDGGSFTFPFFLIWTEEIFWNPTDAVTQAITATLDFFDPATQAVVPGITLALLRPYPRSARYFGPIL